MQLKTKAGIGLVVVGFGVFVAWKAWTATRNETPLDVPITLRAGERVARDFRLNLEGLYLIEIATENAAPDSKAPCLLGVAMNPSECAGITPAVGVDWVLLREGQEIRHGSSNEPHSEAADARGPVRVIGEFPGEASRDYQLRVSINTDGRSLDPAHPRLRVAISSLARTDFQSADVLVFSVSFICVMFGVILLGISLIPQYAS